MVGAREISVGSIFNLNNSNSGVTSVVVDDAADVLKAFDFEVESEVVSSSLESSKVNIGLFLLFKMSACAGFAIIFGVDSDNSKIKNRKEKKRNLNLEN